MFKSIKLLSLSLVLIFWTQLLSGQCTISNLSVDNEVCIEANFYSFSLNFNISENPANSFDLFLNGEKYGSYLFEDLPITVEEFQGSTDGIDTLVVCANDAEDCCADLIIESPCDCDYFNINSFVSECTEDSMWLSLDFDYINVADSFLCGTPGFFLGTHHVNELPVTLGPLPRDISPAEILISSQNDIFCFDSFVVEQEGCDQCLINNLTATALECNDDAEFYVLISFEYMNTSDAGFMIRGNGNDYGTFFYEDSIELGNGVFMDTLIVGPLPGDCETAWEFILIDQGDDQCQNATGIEPVCCEVPCEIFDVRVNELECTGNETASFYLDFEYENPEHSLFELFSGELYLGTYELANLPIFVENFPVNVGNTILLVRINDQEDCWGKFIIEDLDCSGTECSIFDLSVNDLECSSTESVQFYLNFEYENPNNNFYELYSGDDFIAYYSLEELPMFIEDFPISGGSANIVVCINDQENCCANLQFDNLNCDELECSIDSIKFEIEYINTDSFYVILEFDYENPASDQFSIRGNGRDYGDFSYGDLPLMLGPYSCHDSISLEFVIRDLIDPECQNFIDVGVIDCYVNALDLFDPNLNIYSTNDILFIEDEEYGTKEMLFQLFNSFGQEIMKTELSGQQSLYKFDISYLVSGVYFARVSSEGNRTTKKLVKAR